MIEEATGYRSKEQVLYDLAKALHFSPQALEANRKGRLSKEQVQRLALRCAKPAILTVVFAVAPFLFWTWMTAGQQQLSFDGALPVFLTQITHAKDLIEIHGKMGGISILASIMISLAIATLMASRVPVRLWFDVIDGKVELREGRLVKREEQTIRPNGRDPIEKYFFCLRYLKMPVNLAAYRALEDGSIYLVYLLPRSEVLASLEPKVDAKVSRDASPGPTAVTAAEKSSQK